QDQTSETDVRPAFGDLDRDGVSDVVMPAEAGTSGTYELRALSGRDGTLLWRRPIPPVPEWQQVWQDAVTPAVVDLDGDGRLEISGLEYFRPQPPQLAQGQRNVRSFALVAATGRERGKWEDAVVPTCGLAGRDTARQAAKPRPLVLKRGQGPPLIAMGLWGY